MEEVQNKNVNLGDYAAIVVRRRWWILIPLFGCWAIVWIASWMIPARYRSETLILIEQQKVPEQYVVPNVSIDLQERLQSMTQQILSRTRLQRIIDQFHLYADKKGRMGGDEVVDLMRKDITIELVQAPGNRKELTAFRIYYEAPRAQTAQQVASQLTSLFIDENLQAQQQQSEQTTSFLATSLEEARKSLSAQEERVREFKARNLGQLPSQMESNVQILNGLQNRHQALSQALANAQQQKLYLESQLGQYQALQITTSQTPSDALSAVDKELEKLRNELTDVQSRYTDSHPDVKKLKAQIAKAERLKERLTSEIPKESLTDASGKRITSPSELQMMSPMLQLQSQLKAVDLEIKNAQTALTRVSAEIGEYQGRINMIPVREQQLADLTRDYEQSKANYDSLLKKQMQSQLATDLEKRQQGQQFRILDPPSLPTKSSFPDRVKFSVFGLLGGLLLAIGAVALIEVTDARVRSEADLKALVSARVLVGIPHLNTPREERAIVRRHVVEWSAAALMVVVMVAGNVFSIYRG